MKKKLSLAKLKKKLQTVFNAYIRERDKGQKCISCGKVKKLQAGHYYAVRFDSLRFNEDNVHGECAGCNCFDQSHLIPYGINLEKKIGVNRLIDLHAAAREYKKTHHKFERYEIEKMIELYKQKIKTL